MPYPEIIQGGMGVNISSWLLAQTVSELGQIGTVSGVALERVMARILQKGDPNGYFRMALSNFPFQNITERVLDDYFVEGGIPEGTPFKGVPMYSVNPSRSLIELIVCANFAFVWLAKQGHKNPVSINYLEKIAIPHIYAITGAMLADVDVITMGAGIPFQIPDVIDALFDGRTAEYRIPVVGENLTTCLMSFDPTAFFGKKLQFEKKPDFLPIIASNVLANIYMQKLFGRIAGFIVEEWTAGGHNAPPRNKLTKIYGPKDFVNYSELAKLGLPFWIGGSKASPEKLTWAKSVGACGIQAGSIFALCEESGMEPKIRREIRRLGFEKRLSVKTDLRVSPTGFPFKVAGLCGTMSEPNVYEKRERICNQGALVELYEKSGGEIGYRCASEPRDSFFAKGGKLDDTIGRGCICNGLISTAGLGNADESPIVTLGDDVSFLQKLMKDSDSSYSAEDVIRWLLRGN